VMEIIENGLEKGNVRRIVQVDPSFLFCAGP